MENITATVIHTVGKPETWAGLDKTIHYYKIHLSNGISAKRQATGGTQAVAIPLHYPQKTFASKDIKRLIKAWGDQPNVVIVNLETEEVIVCG